MFKLQLSLCIVLTIILNFFLNCDIYANTESIKGTVGLKLESGEYIPSQMVSVFVEFHPICAQTILTRYMKENLIAPIAYSCLAPLSTWRVEKGQGGEVLAEIKEECQLVVNEIAKKLKVSEAKLLLRWGLQHGYCVLTRSSKPERIRENLDVFEFEIPDNDMERLNRLNQNQAIAWAANGLNPMEAAPPLK